MFWRSVEDTLRLIKEKATELVVWYFVDKQNEAGITLWTKRKNPLSIYFCSVPRALELLGFMLGSMLQSPRTSCGVGDPLLCGTLGRSNPNVGLSLIRICVVWRFETHIRLVCTSCQSDVERKVRHSLQQTLCILVSIGVIYSQYFMNSMQSCFWNKYRCHIFQIDYEFDVNGFATRDYSSIFN